MAEGISGKLFEDVTFTTIPSEDLSFGFAFDLRDVVDARGGRYIALRDSDQQIEDLDALTHIISTHIDFPQYSAALERGISVVKPSWIVTSANKNRLATPRQHCPDPAQYMHDVIVTTAGLLDGEKDAIVAGVITLGGQHSGFLSKLVTHIVARDTNNEKCQKAQELGLNCKIVVPNWFDDCFKLGRKISERPYMFPDPEILQREHKTKIREIPSAALEGATEVTPSSMPEASPPPSPTEVRKNLNAFMCRKILLSKDLQLDSSHQKTLEGLINHGGGTLTTEVEDADIYICYYRDGEDFVKAARASKEVANLSWLYNVINRNKYTSPLSKLFHYPIPRDGIPGFQNMKVSISNYSGDARIYLENLIKYCGAEFTRTMKQDNTHLITAHTQSEKCEAAQEWNINIVNHIWLEESYAKCAVQSLTNPRYTTFPARTNLGEVTGQTSLDMKRVEQVYFPKMRGSPQKPSVQGAPSNKPSPRKTVSSTLASTAINQPEATMVHPEDDEPQVDQTEPQTAKKPRGRPRRSIGTPASHFRDDEKENESPLLPHSSGRASKTKALDTLHRQAGDIALYQKEMKRKGGVTHGGRRSSLGGDTSSPAPVSSAQPKGKRKSDEMTYDVTAEGSDLSDGETQAAKPGKKAKNARTSEDSFPPIQYKMLVTGDTRWVGKEHQEAKDRMKLRELGILLVTEAKDIDILVAPKILRTKKFVAALACAPTVVHTDFLDAALKDKKLIEEPDLLDDPETEKKYDFSLSGSLERAAKNKGKLLHGWNVFVTKDVNGGFDTYKEIITLNGGSCFQYAGRTGLTLPKRSLNPKSSQTLTQDSEDEDEGEYDDYVYLLSGTTDPEVKLWKTFRNLAEKQGLKARVVRNDWLLTSCIAQEMRWDPEWELTDEKVKG